MAKKKTKKKKIFLKKIKRRSDNWWDDVEQKVSLQNSQKYSECQLVTALNATYCLGEQPIKPDSSEYERLVDFVSARDGSAIRIEKSYSYLKLRFLDIKPDFEHIQGALSQGMPVSFGVWTEKHGFHSVLITEIQHDNKKGGYQLRVPNLQPYTDKEMWIHWKDLKKLQRVDKNIGPENGYLRAFFRDPLFAPESYTNGASKGKSSGKN